MRALPPLENARTRACGVGTVAGDFAPASLCTALSPPLRLQPATTGQELTRPVLRFNNLQCRALPVHVDEAASLVRVLSDKAAALEARQRELGSTSESQCSLTSGYLLCAACFQPDEAYVARIMRLCWRASERENRLRDKRSRCHAVTQGQIAAVRGKHCMHCRCSNKGLLLHMQPRAMQGAGLTGLLLPQLLIALRRPPMCSAVTSSFRCLRLLCSSWRRDVTRSWE
jgi:hypothetical protein